ncbi:MAG: hypothetical protein NUV91_07630, partial [Candidatus Omnitrophica bacterium]|nr:hypothetical protein [Candidatus Omnitrophota bacterium]
MTHLKKISIKTKLIFIIMTTAIATLILTCLAFVINETFIYRRQIVEDFSVHAQAIGDNVTASLLFNDKKAANDILQVFRDIKNIVAVRLYDDKG